MKKQWLQTAVMMVGVAVVGTTFLATPSEARSHVSLNFGLGVGPYWGGPSYWGPRYYGPAYYEPYPYYYPRPYTAYAPPPASTPYYGTGVNATVGLDLFPAPLGEQFDNRTKDIYFGAYRQALAAPIGDTITWSDGAVSGGVTTTRDGWAGQRYCREFRQTIDVDGRRQDAIGTTCRDPNGVWQLVPNQH